MSYIASSYLDKSLTPLERVYRIWFATFSFRIWRYWMCCDETYSLGVNFITLNAYLCCEINAHGLILLIEKLRHRPELFQPWKFSSQSCEAFFRALRAFSYAQSTQVNFTMKELFVSRCQKVDATIRLTAQGQQDGLDYPRERRAFDMEEPVVHSLQMPSMDEIEFTVLRAKQDAEIELKEIGKQN